MPVVTASADYRPYHTGRTGTVPDPNLSSRRPSSTSKPNPTHPSYFQDPPTMASLIAILDLKGKPLIQRSYRDDVPASCIERFLPLVLDLEEEGQQVIPCFSSQGINYMHIRHSNLYRECPGWIRLLLLFFDVCARGCILHLGARVQAGWNRDWIIY